MRAPGRGCGASRSPRTAAPWWRWLPGAAHATKRWPDEHWTMLARQVGGAPAPTSRRWAARRTSALGAEIAERAGVSVASVAGILGLQETGAVIRRAAVLVSGDTGVMHMATGVGTPVVALFGPTVRQFGFFPYNAEHATVVELELDLPALQQPGRASLPAGTPPLPSRHRAGQTYSSGCARRWHERLGSRRDLPAGPAAADRPRTAPGRDLRALAHRAGRAGPAARSAPGAGPPPPASGAGAPALQPHPAPAAPPGAGGGDEPAARTAGRRPRRRC